MLLRRPISHEHGFGKTLKLKDTDESGTRDGPSPMCMLVETWVAWATSCNDAESRAKSSKAASVPGRVDQVASSLLAVPRLLRILFGKCRKSGLIFRMCGGLGEYCSKFTSRTEDAV